MTGKLNLKLYCMVHQHMHTVLHQMSCLVKFQSLVDKALHQSYIIMESDGTLLSLLQIRYTYIYVCIVPLKDTITNAHYTALVS